MSAVLHAANISQLLFDAAAEGIPGVALFGPHIYAGLPVSMKRELWNIVTHQLEKAKLDKLYYVVKHNGTHLIVSATAKLLDATAPPEPARDRYRICNKRDGVMYQKSMNQQK